MVALCQRETFLCHSLWQSANTWSVMFENLQGGQFNYVINSVDSTKLPCYTLPQTQHHGFLRNLPSFIHIFYLLLNYFKTILLFYFSNLFFFAIGDPICDLVRDPIRSDPIQSDPIRSWFCQGVHILINPQPQLFLHEHVSYNCC